MENPNTGSQTVARAIELLRLVSKGGRVGLRLSEATQASGLSRPTAHRLLKELIDGGLLMRSANKRYFLGQFAYELGLSAATQFHLRDLCAPCLDRLAQETGDTVFLVVRSGPDSFCLDRRTGAFPVKVFSVEVGHRQPMGVGAGGLALLSWLPEQDRRSTIARNAAALPQHGGLTASALTRLVEEARAQGFSRVADFAIQGVTGVGMPVCDDQGVPIVALSVTSISARMTAEHQGEVLRGLSREAAKLKQLLGATLQAARIDARP
ncbi:MAG: IclR family transcriptional regulator [Variovorax paradoxus]|uniref:IclR family transcriptional regulator n=1 Tax=Variovorax paradoxus TaxID=34073 RepID=A0A2W5STN5_VARPD|nr:MAG: IclR family transcriptional regulator [Variovorax paradoxus]